METGTKISIGVHGALLALAVFGGPLFKADESRAIQISEVSIVTSADFDAMMSSAPAPQVDQPEQSQPVTDTETANAPAAEQPPEEQVASEIDTAPADTTPDVAELAKPSPPTQPEVAVESPVIAEQAKEATGSAVSVPQAQESKTDQSGETKPEQLVMLKPKPRPAPRVDTEVAPKPPTDADTSNKAEASTEPDNTEAKPTEEKQEVAPPEATTEIVTEAEVDPNSAAPVKSARPKGRPSDLIQKAQAAKDAAAKEVAEAKAADDKAKADKLAKEKASKDADEKARKAAEAKAIEDALKAAVSEGGNTKPTGPPLSGSEKGALVLAVQKCWNVPVGVVNAADLVVVLSVELTPEGKLKGSPKLIQPSGTPQGAVQQAYEAGRRALIRCAPYSLPKEKYEQWRQIEVVFNPQNMVVK